MEKLLYPIHTADPEYPGELWLLPAGWRMSRKAAQPGTAAGSDDRFAKYAATVQDFGWSNFYAAYEGERFFNWFRDSLLHGGPKRNADTAPPRRFDAILIDSRTGVTEVGGVCTRQLADVVVSFCAPNYQNLSGAERMAASFVPSEDRQERGERELEVLVVPTRVDEAGETDAQNEFRKRFLAAVKTPRALSESSATAWDLLIPYVTKYAYAEALAVGRKDSNQRLEQAYRNLAAHLVLLSREDSPLRSFLSEDLQTIRRRRPRIFVLNSPQDAAAASRIANTLQGVSLAGHLTDASSVLVCFNGPLELEVRQQIRRARQRGACIFAVTEAADAGTPPRILQRVPIFHFPQQQEELTRQLRAPCQSRRAPLTAPSVAPGYIESPEHLSQLKAALLPRPGQTRSPLVSLSGPPGSGKTSLAARLCAEEEILDEYADGVLWVTPGEAGDVLGCLRSIVTAFTGEMATDSTIADAVARVAQHLAGTSCLLVVDDVTRREYVDPFLQLGQVARLIVMRNPGIVPEARSIVLEFMSNAQATDVLLQLAPHADRALFSRLAYRLGGWPVALGTARHVLAQSAAKGEDPNSTAARMIAELERGHLGVLGEGSALLLQRSRRRIDAALDQLAAPEQATFRELRAFQDQPTLPVDSFPARWTLGEVRFRQMLAAFEAHHLVAVDSERAAIEIPVFVSLYLRDLRDPPEGVPRTAVVLRPFGLKGGIDFDHVQRDLVDPALKQLGVRATTSNSFIEAGFIRDDLLQELLTADLLIADVSVPDTGLFYQLGIRHALRNNRTILLRSAAAEPAFDLRTNQDVGYDPRDPGKGVDILVKVVQIALASDRNDSPVFHSVRGLPSIDPHKFFQVPREFEEDVDVARKSGATADLRLFSEEIRELPWAREGLRLIGRAQSTLASWPGAADTWEALLAREPADGEPNLRLAHVYQRLDRHEDAEKAVDRALEQSHLSPLQRADALGLKGSVARSHWAAQWRAASDAPATALRSPFLRRALDSFIASFQEDLNEHWSGMNALRLATILVHLANAMPDVWEEQFESEPEARLELSKIEAHRTALAAATELALRSVQMRTPEDIWVRISAADLRLLRGGRPGYVAAEFRRAIVDAPPAVATAVRGQLEVLASLGVLPELTNAALEALPPATMLAVDQPTLAVLFFGHMLDGPGRATARFPVDAEPRVREALVQTLRSIASRVPDQRIAGFAGASAGGDILFHETCIELGLASTVCLPVPARDYIASSVQYAGPEWVGRFHRLQEARPFRHLARSSDLPGWLKEKPLYSIWERNLSWELHLALEAGRNNVLLLALWDDSATGVKGGVGDFVNQGKARGLPMLIVDLAAVRAGDG